MPLYDFSRGLSTNVQLMSVLSWRRCAGGDVLGGRCVRVCVREWLLTVNVRSSHFTSPERAWENS